MPNDIPLWVLTCAPGSRQAEAETVLRIASDPARRVLVTTLPDPIQSLDEGHLRLYPDTDINISKWWTVGLDFIANFMERAGATQWDVLMIESDGRMTREDVDTVRTVMRDEDCVLAAPDWQGSTSGVSKVRRDNSVWINDVNGRADYSRLPGMAMVLAGESGLRHDTEFRWWLADDDLEWQARVSGGTVLVTGTRFEHEGTTGPLTGERLTAWEEDSIKFLDKWGGLPAYGGVLKK